MGALLAIEMALSTTVASRLGTRNSYSRFTASRTKDP
jgi:hypothetical protein